jgi:hypothetical protein
MYTYIYLLYNPYTLILINNHLESLGFVLFRLIVEAKKWAMNDIRWDYLIHGSVYQINGNKKGS